MTKANAFEYEKTRLRACYGKTIKAVAEEFGIQKDQFWGKNRHRYLVTARSALAQELLALGLTTTTIGKIMDRDHTTVCHLLGTTTKGKVYAEKYNRRRACSGGDSCVAGGQGTQANP